MKKKHGDPTGSQIFAEGWEATGVDITKALLFCFVFKNTSKLLLQWFSERHPKANHVNQAGLEVIQGIAYSDRKSVYEKVDLKFLGFLRISRGIFSKINFSYTFFLVLSLLYPSLSQHDFQSFPAEAFYSQRISD